jgi:hypothetical protein
MSAVKDFVLFIYIVVIERKDSFIIIN